MTDVESKTPNKRKSLAPNSGKKMKLDKSVGSKLKSPGKTPSKQQNGGKLTQNRKTPKQQNLQSKSKKKSEISPKKVKAFLGTAVIETAKGRIVKLNKNQEKQEENNIVKKKRRTFYQLKVKAKSGDEAVVKTIEDKIKAIESRGDLTKTALRKVKLLRRFKNIAQGKIAEPQKKDPHAKSVSTKRRERKKNAKSAQKPIIKYKQQPKVEAKVESDEEESDDNDADGSGEEVENEDSSDGVEDEVESSDKAESVDEEDSDDVFEEESVPQGKPNQHEKAKPKSYKAGTINNKPQQKVNLGLEDLQKNNVIEKNQKRYVLFVGNIPYDTNKVELSQHFEKCGAIKHIRIPTEMKTEKARGFAYVEVENEESYQKCLSLHHSFLKGRKINVLYTQSGKKMGEDKKKKIKAKNFKLHAMRKQGQLLGCKKESRKRSFRRMKQRMQKNNNSEL